jgi:hypothetical protein
MLTPCSNPPDYLLYQIAYKMPFEPQHPIVSIYGVVHV